MNTIYPLVEPVFNFWHYLTHDPYLEQLNEFKGGALPGNEWHTKYLRAEMNNVNSKIDYLHKQFNSEPSLVDVLWDNKWRLTILAGFERLITVRQAQSFLNTRFMLFDNNSSVLNSIFHQGLVKGFFRGYLINLAQFVSVQYHSLLWSYNTSMSSHFLISSIIEAAFYPLDTVKTLIYSDLNRKYTGFRHCLRSILTESTMTHLYRGLSMKLMYNGAFLFNLRNMYEGNSLSYVSLPLWLASYCFLTIKTRLQVCDTSLSYQNSDNIRKVIARMFRNQSVGSLYAGFLPFAAINLLFSYTFYSLYSEDARKKALFEHVEEIENLDRLTSN